MDIDVGLIAVTQVLDGDHNSHFIWEYIYIMGITVVERKKDAKLTHFAGCDLVTCHITPGR